MEKNGGTFDFEISEPLGGTKEIKHVTVNLHSTSELTFKGATGVGQYDELKLWRQSGEMSLSNEGKDAVYTFDLVTRYNTTEYGDFAVYCYADGVSTQYSIIGGILPNILQKPVVSAELLDSAGGWNRSTVARINATEVYTNAATLTLVCNGKELLKKQYIPTNNAFTDDIELNGLGIENGSKLEWIVTLNEKVSSTYEMNMTNIDVTGPLLNTELEINDNWTKIRKLNVNYHDEGVGNDRVYLANTNYIYGTKEGETSEDVLFELTGDVYSEKELNVFAVDSLGNYTVKTIIVNKLDNTQPIITNASMQGSKLVIDANDEKEGLGEGSGVIKYRYLTSKERLENPEITSENSTEVSKNNEIRLSNLNEANFVYIVAEDAAGNISEVYELILQELVLTSKVNLDLANGNGGVELDWSDYDPTGVYFVIYRKEENSENFEKIVSVEDKYSNNTYIDILGNDKEKPSVPTVNLGTTSSEVQINLSSEDSGTTYTYYIEAYDVNTNTLLRMSNKKSEKI